MHVIEQKPQDGLELLKSGCLDCPWTTVVTTLLVLKVAPWGILLLRWRLSLEAQRTSVLSWLLWLSVGLWLDF